MTYLGEPWSSGEKTHAQEVVGLNPSTGIWMDILKQTDVPREDKIGQGCATPRQSR